MERFKKGKKKDGNNKYITTCGDLKHFAKQVDEKKFSDKHFQKAYEKIQNTCIWKKGRHMMIDVLITLSIAVPVTAFTILLIAACGVAGRENEAYMEGFNAGLDEGYKKGLDAAFPFEGGKK